MQYLVITRICYHHQRKNGVNGSVVGKIKGPWKVPPRECATILKLFFKKGLKQALFISVGLGGFGIVDCTLSYAIHPSPSLLPLSTMEVEGSQKKSFPLALKSVEAKKTEIIFWHSMAGSLGQELNALVDQFNRTSSAYHIKLVYKGDYVESLTSFAAAFRAKQAPAMIQVFEVGTATMLHPSGVIKPVERLMQEQGFDLPKEDFFPGVRAYYSEKDQLMAMPFNISLPVVFYNKTALASIGYTEQSFPTTWEGMEQLAKKLKKAGFLCAYTSAYPAWIFIESFSAIQGLPLKEPSHGHLAYNNTVVLQHLTRLRRWQAHHYFEYGGRTDDATILFTSGRCPLFSQSSGAYQSLSVLSPFPVGIGALPYETSSKRAGVGQVVGGAALWVVANQPRRVYRGIAHFFRYLAMPEVQARWHQRTGYLPLGVNGIYRSLLLQSHNPALQLAKKAWCSGSSFSSLSRLKVQNHIRAINDEALEMIFAGIKTPKEAMDEAVMRAEQVLQRAS